MLKGTENVQLPNIAKGVEQIVPIEGEDIDKDPLDPINLFTRVEEYLERTKKLEDMIGRLDYAMRPQISTADSKEVTVCNENQEAFRKLLPALLKDPNKRDCYVAIWEGREWDSDENEFVLAKRMFGSVGADKSFFIGLVSSTEPYRRLPSPRRLG